jgi:ferritin-like protein
MMASGEAVVVALLVMSMRLHDLNLIACYCFASIVSVVMCVWPWLPNADTTDSARVASISAILGALAGCTFVCLLRHISLGHDAGTDELRPRKADGYARDESRREAVAPPDRQHRLAR